MVEILRRRRFAFHNEFHSRYFVNKIRLENNKQSTLSAITLVTTVLRISTAFEQPIEKLYEDHFVQTYFFLLACGDIGNGVMEEFEFGHDNDPAGKTLGTKGVVII